MKEIGLEYDCSWPTVNYITPGIWPYTLDYKTTQDCPIGPCPSESYPGVWVFPMIDLDDFDGFKCSMADSCTNVCVNYNLVSFKLYFLFDALQRNRC